jgi:hypothetical protein
MPGKTIRNIFLLVFHNCLLIMHVCEMSIGSGAYMA